MMGFWDWFARLVAITTAVLSARVVLVERSTSLETAMPHAPEAETPSARKVIGSVPSKPQAVGEASPTASVLGVKYRLVERLDSAEIAVPALDDPRIRSLLRAHWRKVHSPLVGPSGSIGRLVAQIGLPASVAAKAEEASESDNHWHADPSCGDSTRERSTNVKPCGHPLLQGSRGR